jgi:hypothetical protein
MPYGRRAECDALDRLLADARRSRSGVLVVRGEAGVGKSALLDHAAGRAEGMTVLRAAGAESEAELPFAALHQLLRRVLGLAGRLPGHWTSKSVLDQHIWSDRDTVELPRQFVTSKVPAVSTAIQVAGVALLAYGLVELDLLAMVAGLVLTQTAKAWYLDRIVLLYEDMKARDPGYAAWER